MSKEKAVYKKSFPVFGVLGIILVVMKVLEVGVVATWSWWLVLLPFYLGLVIFVGFLAAGGFFLGVVALIAAILDFFDK